MLVYLQEFDLEFSESCHKDYFSVQTSKNDLEIHKYCSSALRRIEVRNRRRVQLWFHSDNTVARRGILATFCFRSWPETEEEKTKPCSCSGDSRPSQRSVDPSRGGEGVRVGM